MKRIIPFFILACLGLSASFAAARPNVIVVLADDLGYSDLGCYGGEIPTPNLDRLAQGGSRFSAFYTSARCCPSRASLMTGLHPHQAGIGSFATDRPRRGWGAAYTGHLLPTCATLAELLGDAGYSTWMVGKWHMSQPGPIARGFQHFYGYTRGYAADQWDPGKYHRLPEGTEPELSFGEDFYATTAFNDYAVEFLEQACQREQPFFLYLAHSSPHFPVQAPAADADKYMDTFRKGWDVLRSERFARQKELGLVASDSELPPIAEVPVDRDDIANGFSGKPNPAWNTLPGDRREDLARRMAIFAAMVEHIDRGVGRLLVGLERAGRLDNTLVVFLSDNGACYEWGPFGFDGPSRKGITRLHAGAELAEVGQDGGWSSYGSGWAGLGNTPLSMYKHFCHEGGLSSPLILNWPAGISSTASWVNEPSHLMDVVPTVLEAAGVVAPVERNGIELTPIEGRSLLPAVRGEAGSERALAFEHQGARGLRRGDWKIVRGKRQPDEVRWELYNLARDRFEQHDLAGTRPELLAELVGEWEAWARRVGAEPFQIPEPAAPPPDASAAAESPVIARKEIVLSAMVEAKAPHGVVLAQGGRERGYALHFVRGQAALDVRVKVGQPPVRLLAPGKPSGRIALRAEITADRLRLTVNGATVTADSPGLIPGQPKDPLSIGRDILSAAGNYPNENPFNGKVIGHQVETREP